MIELYICLIDLRSTPAQGPSGPPTTNKKEKEPEKMVSNKFLVYNWEFIYSRVATVGTSAKSQSENRRGVRIVSYRMFDDRPPHRAFVVLIPGKVKTK